MVACTWVDPAYKLFALKEALIKRGLVTREELDTRIRPVESVASGRAPKTMLTAGIVFVVVATNASVRAPAEVAPRFKRGDRVRLCDHNPSTPTRLPVNIRSKL